MSEEVSAAPAMASITARYQTRVTAVPAGTGTPYLILRADARRVFAQFFAGSGALSNPQVLPGPPLPGVTLGSAPASPPEWKWKDVPSITTGEFYCYNSPAVVVVAVECLYLGG